MIAHRKREWAEVILKEAMAKKFSKLTKDSKSRNQEVIQACQGKMCTQKTLSIS
jgi:hypothetical protein